MSVVEQVVAHISGMSSSLVSSWQAYSHFLSDTCYVRSKVATELLNNKNRKSWLSNTEDLHNAMRSFARDYRNLCGDQKPELEHESLAESRRVLTSAKAFICVLSFASCVQEQSGTEQLDAAQKLLAKQATSVPKALADAVQAIVDARHARHKSDEPKAKRPRH